MANEGAATGGVVARAEAAIAAGERWRARDLLTAYAEQHDDAEVLGLLGQVLHDMGDLPAAGAAWFGSGVKGPQVDAAIAAWRDRHGDDFGDMWRTLPRSVRVPPYPPKVEALRAKAIIADQERTVATAGDPAEAPTGIDAAQIIAWVLAAGFVVCAVVGLVVILQWMVPGS